MLDYEDVQKTRPQYDPVTDFRSMKILDEIIDSCDRTCGEELFHQVCMFLAWCVMYHKGLAADFHDACLLHV